MSMTNPRAVIGSNAGEASDYAREESERLQRDYAETFRVVEELLAEYETIPEKLATPEDKSKVVSLIKRMRDTSKSILAYHALEKMPHYRRGQGVDQTFFGENDKLAKRDKNGKDGAADSLGQRLTEYDVAELAREQSRRRQAALDARKEADQALAEAEVAAAELAAAEKRQAEAEAAAARARKPENVAAHQQAAQVASAEANRAAEVIAGASATVAVADARAEKAYIETLATPADMMRERHADGSLSSMGTEKFATILDRDTLDLEKLRPFLPLAALQTALNGYAASFGHSSDAAVQIAGAKFGKRPKSQVR